MKWKQALWGLPVLGAVALGIGTDRWLAAGAADAGRPAGAHPDDPRGHPPRPTLRVAPAAGPAAGALIRLAADPRLSGGVSP